MSTTPKIGLFPGTFDPITNGHLDVIQRGQRHFDKLVIAIGENPAKKPLFSTPERLDIIQSLINEQLDPSIVELQTYTGLTVDFAKQIGATAILRGLRNVTDLNFEFQLALTNRSIADIETIFIMSGETYGFTSSTLIKQIAAGGDINRLHDLLPHIVIEKLKQKKIDHGGKLPWRTIDHFTESTEAE
ncbi:pantetheine-phosphate adenylyltransferase [Poriferisphaera sp. WC338]|uniref:pantetheine-phosphate adenylyltransferase n=1 Tax=Poriferisphaera sp. WC338 TaxID=3425129 RepID=UPI003D81749D